MLYQRIPGLVSVVITNHNRAPFLEDCLNSLLKQTYQEWEIILIDDASTDDSVKCIENWLTANRKLFPRQNTFLTLQLPRNVGFAGAMNVGLFLAKGEFIAVQDSDDLSHHERFEKQIAYLTNNPDTDLIGTNYVAFENNRLDQIIGSGKGWIRYGDNIPKMYAKGGHCICHGTILFRGSLFDRIGGHTRRVSGAEDYEFIVKCINSKSKIENLPDPLYYYRNHPQQRSRRYFSLEWNEESDE